MTVVIGDRGPFELTKELESSARAAEAFKSFAAAVGADADLGGRSDRSRGIEDVLPSRR